MRPLYREDGQPHGDGRLWCATCLRWQPPAVWFFHHGKAPDGGPLAGRVFDLGVLPDEAAPVTADDWHEVGF